jgi:hypothetical protein
MKTEEEVIQFLQECDGGNLLPRLAAALSDAAIGSVAVAKKNGKVTLQFDFSQVGESNQVMIDHTVTFTAPTQRGKRSEEHTTTTAMYVSNRGDMTILPNDTRALFPNGAKTHSEA